MAVAPPVVDRVPVRARAYAPSSVPPAVDHTHDARSRDSRAWLGALRGPEPARERAVSELHTLLLRAAQHELRRRRQALAHIASQELEDLALQAADDALVAVLDKLDSFRGESRFTTWVYKFALFEAGVKARRRAWHGREVVLDGATGAVFAAPGPSAEQTVEQTELLAAIGDAVRTRLTPHQREVFIALALNEIPIDVLAERLGTTRGALYKTLHDARRKLRSAVSEAGYVLDVERRVPEERS
jgi:RNA polymerase sigma-70 factor, ECF subfamily